jgi:hypothetical protein
MTVYAPPKVRSPLRSPDQNRVSREAGLANAPAESGMSWVSGRPDNGKNNCQYFQFAFGNCKDQTGREKRKKKIDLEQLRKCSQAGNAPKPGIGVQGVTPNPVYRADDERGHRRLHSRKDRLKELRVDPKAHIKPGKRQHQDKTGQHKTEPGQ